jgi:cellulose 1,4-beta-cellobiosidase
MFKTFLGSCALLVLMLVSGCGSSQAPTTPTGLTVTSTGPITLSWTASSGASNYVIFRGTASGSITTKTLLTAAVSGTSYTDLPTLVGTTYYYQITAVNSDGQSAPSSEVNATGTFSLSASTHLLSWNSISNAVSYTVYRSINADMSSKETLSPGVALASYTDTTGVTGTTYYYQVAAVNSSSTEFASSSIQQLTY